MNKFPIIDCHCHIYPEKIAAKAVVGIGEFYHLQMNYDGRLQTLLSESEKNGITHNIIFSVATKPSQVRSINAFIADMVAQNPERFIGLGTLHPDSEDIEGDIKDLLALGLKGVKLHPDIQGIAVNDSRCEKIYRLCEGVLPILIHAGDKRYDFSNPNRIKPILERFPNLTVIAAHFAGYSVWEEAKKELAGYPNLYVDCSSSLAMLTVEEANALVRAYGVDKVLFATDFPMWTMSKEMERFNALTLSEEEREQIFYKNACRLFGLSL